ncbi:MAG: DUF1566 domain-containing protein [Desulfobacterales bacterium]|nr:DUF1566 domain-containing protein [Desulfobacterales bacterium]
MMGKFFFNPQPVKDQVTPKKGNPLPAGAGSEELLFWESVRNATDAKMYQAYVDNFPDGVFTDLAKIKIRDLEASSSISPASQATDKSDIVSKDAYWEQLPEEKTAMTQRFIKDENGIVHDRKTDLQWVEGPAEKLLWREAKNWVDNLELDGGGWRLPGKAELESLYKNGAGPRNMPPILSTTAWEVFSDDSQSEQWQWIFFFKKGYGNNSGPMDECRVFAVRSRE